MRYLISENKFYSMARVYTPFKNMNEEEEAA
jgi:hypothetical protein